MQREHAITISQFTPCGATVTPWAPTGADLAAELAGVVREELGRLRADMQCADNRLALRLDSIIYLTGHLAA